MSHRRRFRSAGNLAAWADNWISQRIARQLGARQELVRELVAACWRDGYRCGRGDRDDEVRRALGMDLELDDADIPIEPWNGAERLQTGRGKLGGR